MNGTHKGRRVSRLVQTIALLVLATNASLAGAQAPSVLPRRAAGYVLPNGAVQIVTASGLAGAVKALNELFVATHRGVTFSVLEGDNYSGMAALTFDRTPVAPLGTEYTRIGLGDNLKIAAEPIGFRIGHASLTSGARVPALGVIVNSGNPLSSVSLAQLTRMFAVGADGGDIATWGQAGVKGPLADREIHPVGPFASDYLDSEDPQVGEFLSTDKMGGLNMNHTYAPMARYADVVQRVREDPAAIGITALNIPRENVKLIAVNTTETGTPVQPTAENIATGRYPLDRFVYMYIRVGKGMAPDPFALEYMKTVLSEAGQRVIAGESAGYLPLNAGELAEERAKLDR